MTILPSAIRGHGYRSEAIDLQPGGATITVSVPSDNPYEMGDDVEVVTQMSGGMAGPDPKMRSKRVAAKGMRRVRPAASAHAGFLPGMGDDLEGDDLEGDEVEVGLFGAVRKPRGGRKAKPSARPKQYLVQARPVHAGFLPGMGTDPNDVMAGFGAEVDAKKAQKVIPAFRPSPSVLARGKALFPSRFNQVDGLGAGEVPFYLRPPEAAQPAPAKAPAAADKPFDWQGLTTGVAAMGKGVAEVMSASAQREAAKAERGPKSITYSTNVAAPAEGGGSKTPWIIGGIGALAAVGILAFVLTRKKA
jgi:hypothetical protein